MGVMMCFFNVLLRYQVTKRSYGALSTTFRKRVDWIEALPVSEPPPEAFTPFSPSPAASGGRSDTAPSPEPKRNVASDRIAVTLDERIEGLAIAGPRPLDHRTCCLSGVHELLHSIRMRGWNPGWLRGK